MNQEKRNDHTSVCFEKVNTTYVYIEDNQLHIRQEDSMGERDDIIAIPLYNVDRLVEKIKSVQQEHAARIQQRDQVRIQQIQPGKMLKRGE